MEELGERLRDFNTDVPLLEGNADDSERTEAINRLFRGAHSLKGAAATVGAVSVELICHQLEDLLGALRDGRCDPAPGLTQLLLETSEAVRNAADAFAEGQPPPIASGLLERVAAASVTTSDDAHGDPTTPPPQRVFSPTTAPAAPTVPRSERPAARATFRVGSDQVDALLEQSGDLLGLQLQIDALQDRVSEAAGRMRVLATELPATQRTTLRELERSIERIGTAIRGDGAVLERIAGEIDNGLRELRVQPFASACEGLERLAHDTALSAGKEVTLDVRGAELGIDRAIAERLRDPLVHLVRNAIDHGIESPSARRTAGKAAHGTITIGAEVHAGRVLVTVADDGRGIDRDEIRRRARARGVSFADDDDVATAIFLPGLSTASQVTGRSGRGVGLDAVRSEIEALRGTVSVSSTEGSGSHFVLSLPFTLTKMRVIAFRVDDQIYALNVAYIERTVRIDPERVTSIEGAPVLMVGDRALRLIAFADVLGREPGGARFALLVQALGTPFALAVDELLGEQHIPFRALPPRLAALPLISGATVLADGTIALVLRGSGVVDQALKTHRRVGGQENGRGAKRVLLVDDSATTRALEQSILETAGYEVLTAADGREAWQLLERSEVDLVVSDVDMPEMDGFALVEAVRRSTKLRDLPVVLVTARDRDEDRQRGLDAGADAYIAKSAFRQETLLDAIGQLL